MVKSIPSIKILKHCHIHVLQNLEQNNVKDLIVHLQNL